MTHACPDCGLARTVSKAQASRIRNGIRSGRCQPCAVRARTVVVLDRFERYVARDVDSGCWFWTGYINDAGYGLFSVRRGRGKSALAYLWRWEHDHGPVPAGLELDHLCRNTRCVNPAHLEPVTHRENVRRAYPLREACPNGHPFTTANSYFHPWKGHGPRCRICRNEGMARRRALATREAVAFEEAA